MRTEKRNVITFAIIVMAGMIFLLAVVSFGPALQDSWFHEGMEFSGDTNAIVFDFQRAFYGRTDYPAYTLEQLRSEGVLPQQICDLIKDHNGRYYPFSPRTPPDAVVLKLRGGFLSLDTFSLTKSELTARPPN